MTDRAGSATVEVPGMVKVPIAVLTIAVLAALPVRYAFWSAAILPLLAACIVWGRIPLRPLLRRLALTEPVILGASMLMLFRPGGAVPFLAILLKATLCIVVAQLLVLSTPFQTIVGVLRKARVPSPLLSTLCLLHRYAPVLADETGRMRRARAARTFGPSRKLRWQMLGAIIGLLFVRSMDRAERIDAAMRARGWS